MKVLGRSIAWRKPLPVDFVIIDEVFSDRCRRILPPGTDIAVISMRPVSLNIHPLVILKTLVCFRDVHPKDWIKYGRNIFVGI